MLKSCQVNDSIEGRIGVGRAPGTLRSRGSWRAERVMRTVRMYSNSLALARLSFAKVANREASWSVTTLRMPIPLSLIVMGRTLCTRCSRAATAWSAQNSSSLIDVPKGNDTSFGWAVSGSAGELRNRIAS